MKLQYLYLYLLLASSSLMAYSQATNGSKNLEDLLSKAEQYYNLNQFSSSMDVFLQAAQMAEEQKNYTKQSYALLKIGSCRYRINNNDWPPILKWWHEALEVAKKHGIDSVMGRASSNISLLYTDKNNLDSAEKYSQMATDIFLRIKEYGRVSVSYNLSALNSIRVEKLFNKADSLLVTAMHYAILSENKSYIGYSNLNRSIFYRHQKDYRVALRYLDSAELYYKAAGDWDGIRYTYKLKIDNLAQLGDTAAIRYTLLWHEMTDSLLRIENAAKVAEFETMFETQKKEKENKLLIEKNKRQQLLLILALVGVISSFIIIALIIRARKQRIEKLKLEQEALAIKNMQKEKERISRDLHDNVGGQLSYVLFSMENIQERDKQKQEDIFENINVAVRSAINNLRETIWSVNDGFITTQDLFDRIKVYAQSIFKHSDIDIHFKENISYNKQKESLKMLNLYRICQEIMNNVFKHAEAKNIHIGIKETETEIIISITDDGKGFELNTNNKSSYGLQNIYARAKEYQFSIECESHINQGTAYTIIVPSKTNGIVQ